ncbi:hypothetical protein Acsp03_22670 [Actinomadura sp. NBRC 104412]|uniref:DUF3224 domain-containing protein n=1 Tax=Actinomadura sp. NBRC 104412 TaxID=3032203 RepID=UPI0024A4D8F2|nr:DUF3224 domain-containing protein [Actinomadura sp. NBRC 104412]GLZ04801.1 hypothetical protein Acsp03_22670 [Actinomadura sp. NBRC 104412]
MTSHATGTFDLDSWDAEKPFHEDIGTKQTRVRVGKTFHGDLVGTSVTELITVESVEGGPLAYVGIETVQGILHGREGTFVLQHSGGSDDGTPETQWLRWLIVSGSGTGELTGIRGEGRIVVGADGTHSWSLDYTLG